MSNHEPVWRTLEIGSSPCSRKAVRPWLRKGATPAAKQGARASGTVRAPDRVHGRLVDEVRGKLWSLGWPRRLGPATAAGMSTGGGDEREAWAHALGPGGVATAKGTANRGNIPGHGYVEHPGRWWRFDRSSPVAMTESPGNPGGIRAGWRLRKGIRRSTGARTGWPGLGACTILPWPRVDTGT